MVEFATWEMPVSYGGATEEHRAVRERCGLFDVSHMGELEVSGRGSLAFLEFLTVNTVARLAQGAGQYSVLCDERGGVLDDLIVYRLGSDRYLLVVNAASTSGDLGWIRAHRMMDVEVIDRSAETALLALQGPAAATVLETVISPALGAFPRFTLREATVAGVPAMVARTGYTGEDGFEIFVATENAGAMWDALSVAMEPVGGVMAGLAARDTLRLEAALPLCGTDMDRSTTPLEAGLDWVVKLGKGEFIGSDALRRQWAEGVPRRLVGIQMDEPAIPRHGFAVTSSGRSVGVVTSGTKSPTLGTCIGLAYVEARVAALGSRVDVDVRGRVVPAHVVARPFYRRPA
jgi:aminomethyltransferase